jgi:F-type H+-transporting ATPase subunit b
MSELVHSLGIEWKILVAQIINFGILFYVLKRFVIGPIMQILDKREARLASDRKMSEEIAQTTLEAEVMKEKLLKEARESSEKVIKSAEAVAKRVHDELVAEARREFEVIVSTGRRVLDEDRRRLEAELKREAGDLIARAVEKAVGESLDKHAHEKLVDEAKRILNGLDVVSNT